ncbi:hypothetical protein SBA1_290095 [Candidatus Sulfotelmatobacter kueseliae]|uniref:Uncharacterized protein n=1 Tax=Candidatus Sulfotelmatobacter kueseliae TaxID=2042962 RepID=A0A2U3KJ97_9BACT|nr:hypothetical protein SBA1_290095 [Candidatus Sulfotelmatobacter kueseliae]
MQEFQGITQFLYQVCQNYVPGLSSRFRQDYNLFRYQRLSSVCTNALFGIQPVVGSTGAKVTGRPGFNGPTLRRRGPSDKSATFCAVQGTRPKFHAR